MKKPTDLHRLADEELMHLVRDGDARAFELVYDRHGGAAFSLAYRMVGDRAIAEDITQEAFLSMWRSRVRHESERGSVRAWGRRRRHDRGPGSRAPRARRGRVPARRAERARGAGVRASHGVVPDLPRRGGAAARGGRRAAALGGAPRSAGLAQAVADAHGARGV